MDCLDRTNVVQTLLARWALIAQLKDLKLLSPLIEDGDAAIALPDTNVEHIFRTMWGDNGEGGDLTYPIDY